MVADSKRLYGTIRLYSFSMCVFYRLGFLKKLKIFKKNVFLLQ